MIAASVTLNTMLSPDVRVLGLKPEQRFSFEPGQHLVVTLQDGPSRCYSMARAPNGDGTIELHIRRRTGGAFSDRGISQIGVGQHVGISGPLGDFRFPAGDGPVVMLATGTGIAPFLAMLEQQLPLNTTRPITLYWGGRSSADLYARDRLLAWQEQYVHFGFVPVTRETTSRYVQDLALREMSCPQATHVLACGSPQMVEAARATFVSNLGTPVLEFMCDVFEPSPECEPVSTQAKSAAATISLTVGGVVTQAPSGLSLLAGLKSAGLPILSVCGGKASCGTCHVLIESAWLARITAPSKAEHNLLACLPDTTAASRLACQIQLTPDLDGLALRLPATGSF
ncbi:FAD-binding oxidoreductase [Silvimonas amylolytica]|uniref:Uncharacterized protein n=1 Tax=Silvimonas amylolytica TaxID=449663 RepID=A0ABQ2PJ88_9NEIS|nr:FAD-binding oxidoreductase [Silvimonas amylolytica]GGP25296.1 hypothetical protein GCM10010971_11150 [Silvimonas amylolytica]